MFGCGRQSHSGEAFCAAGVSLLSSFGRCFGVVGDAVAQSLFLAGLGVEPAGGGHKFLCCLLCDAVARHVDTGDYAVHGGEVFGGGLQFLNLFGDLVFVELPKGVYPKACLVYELQGGGTLHNFVRARGDDRSRRGGEAVNIGRNLSLSFKEDLPNLQRLVHVAAERADIYVDRLIVGYVFQRVLHIGGIDAPVPVNFIVDVNVVFHVANIY